ncbi:putative bacteriocin export ABC transporter [Priestia megaterium]|jgi:putative ABC transport system ATP-binding protein|uniref:putative bacteriocin export ABC transporter n=1 Tax=Priestia TaxID=2800373 RepID=UPI000BEBCD43|nr:putative bacteriocin export ABC transporter [Priestia megaterium]MED3854928.1 putative bacteriocin export ABC transporter [Priestia megaterium]PEB61099.1 bacteriocin ABC transporter ATP-binding protein [Priestia megaterium]PEE73305.1 bacteriocin ABC transporter ATP-binding protein [Priestia megaterium]PFI94187.1 bacteriocin ABC transporter ATP-binding protein [Priestia megaterium]PGR04392.1 bacteriocin ABC transporter ATP-binding protein [Priestia megaterium]
METLCNLVSVNKSYNKKLVLNSIDLKVYKGEMVAITGESGSGKTTLLNIIGMLEKPSDGEVQLFEQDISSISAIERAQILRTKVSYLFQNYALVENADINYNLEIPLIYSKKTKKEKKKMKIEALNKVGLDIALNQKVHELSGGEQQRVAIARLFLKSCDLVLADEPTGSLDSTNRDEIIKLLKILNEQGKTIIIVTHDEFVVKECKRSIELS